MKMTISTSEFIQAFADHGREDNFSREGLVHLFDYLEEIDPDMELDVISICCGFEELELVDLPDEYGYLLDSQETGVDAESLDMNEWVSILADRTTVIWHDENSVLFAQF